MNKDIITEEVMLEITDSMIGNIGFYGCSQRDGVSLKNLDRVESVLYHYTGNLIDKINNHHKDYRYSGKALSNRSIEILKGIKKDIDNILNNIMEDN